MRNDGSTEFRVHISRQRVKEKAQAWRQLALSGRLASTGRRCIMVVDGENNARRSQLKTQARRPTQPASRPGIQPTLDPPAQCSRRRGPSLVGNLQEYSPCTLKLLNSQLEWKMKKPERPGRTSARAQPAVPTPSSPYDDCLDLAGVDPLRINEVRRRVAVVRAYLAEPAPDERARRRHAALLGLSVSQFLALVRAWREHGRAVAMSGAGAARGKPRAAVPRSLPTKSKDAALAVIASLGPDVAHVDAVKAVEARCASLGTKTPSRSTIWNIIMSVRRDAAQRTSIEGIIVSRCHVKIPVETTGATLFPWIVMVVDSADGEILAAAMGEERLVQATILSGLRRRGPECEVVMDSEIATALPSPGKYKLVKPSVARTVTTKVLGRGFGSIELIYHLSRAIDPERSLRARKDTPLQQEDVHRVIWNELSAHNAARGSLPPAVSWRL